MVGVIEVEDDRAVGKIGAQIGALVAVYQVPTGPIRFIPACAIAERHKEPARIAVHPERGQAVSLVLEAELQVANAAEAEILCLAGELSFTCGELRGYPHRRIVGPVPQALERGPLGGGNWALRMRSEECVFFGPEPGQRLRVGCP